ncbi:MAG: alpha-L-rhamnosidase N-terminal domain-containing protein, partial [Oscillospiraceae bacterium]|nr:alpha-L-rhamnosidase N-terminal domain-containing protein [Oscillospiraceae bacterium]
MSKFFSKMHRYILSLLVALMLMPRVSSAQKAANDVFGEAQWIGGSDDDMVLYAQYLTTFRLSWTVEGSGWLRFGGGDERLLNAYRNPWHLANAADSVYVRVEADGARGELRFYRSGMSPKDRPEVAGCVLKSPRLMAEGAHQVDLAVAFGTTDVSVDGEKIGTVNLNPVRGAMNRGLNLSGDYAAYPCLGNTDCGGGNVTCGGGNATCGGGNGAAVVRHYRSPGNVIARATPGKAGSLFRNRSCLQLRSRFPIYKKVRKAVLKATARGIYDAYINGALVNKGAWFCPGFTQYDRTQLFQTYDVTAYLREGDNSIGAVL